MIEDLDGEQLAFVVHDGDFKSGSSPCTDDVYRREFERFHRFAHPVVHTPGDNEWTDCHVSGGDPLERLAALRALFFSGDQSLGVRPLLTSGQAGYPRTVARVPVP